VQGLDAELSHYEDHSPSENRHGGERGEENPSKASDCMRVLEDGKGVES